MILCKASPPESVSWVLGFSFLSLLKVHIEKSQTDLQVHFYSLLKTKVWPYFPRGDKESNQVKEQKHEMQLKSRQYITKLLKALAKQALALTCKDLSSLRSRSNLHASWCKFSTFWPPNASQSKLSDIQVDCAVGCADLALKWVSLTCMSLKVNVSGPVWPPNASP